MYRMHIHVLLMPSQHSHKGRRPSRQDVRINLTSPFPSASSFHPLPCAHLAPCSFYDKEAPIYTMSRFLPPSKVAQDVTIRNAIIGDGSNIKARSLISNSIIGLRSLVGEDCVVEDTLMLGSDYYETVEECAWVPGCLPMGIGAGSVIRKVSVAHL